MAWTRTKQETLALPINALALLILKDYTSSGGWNWQNWMRASEQHGTARDKEISEALAEGWGWLMTHGLVVRDPAQSSPDAYRITRLGRDTVEHGIAKLTAAERLRISLHRRIAERVEQQFLLGEYELAVFAAMREVEIRVRELAGAPASLLGVPLMQQAFAPKSPGPLVDTKAEGGEQEAAMNLFKGAIGLFKNPTSHRAVDYDDPIVASEVVLLADLLLRLLDQVEDRLRQ
ncbi:TIGR02391 family protein [Amycolatopsis sp. NPDC051371]|uniref:TIGR02391 family protein n=1 Tax=Amycolatopsis sp. NPDC051371 TaxID=3155800 RepID=UPI0034321274